MSGSRITFFLSYMNCDQVAVLVHGKLPAELRTIPRLPPFLSEDRWFSSCQQTIPFPLHPRLFFIRPFYSLSHLLFSCLSITISSSPAVARFNATLTMLPPRTYITCTSPVPASIFPRLDPCLPVIRLQLFAFPWVLFISPPPAAQPFRRLP